MLQVRRSLLSETTSSAVRTGSNDDLCKLCYRLGHKNSRILQKFTSISLKTNHAQIHNNQHLRTIDNNISQNNNLTISGNHDIFMEKCFGLSYQQNKIISNKNNSSDKLNFKTTTVSKKVSVGINESTGLEQIRAMIPSTGKKSCKMCKNEKRPKSLKIIDKKKSDELRLDLIILHSIKRHFSCPDMYTCNICEYSTNSIENENGMYEHYSTKHSHIEPHTVKSPYFTANYLKNKAVILETITKCFGFELIDCDSKLLELEKLHESSATKLRLIFLRKQLAEQKFFECRKCAKRINFRTTGTGNEWGRIALLEHANLHMIKTPIMRCLLCDTSVSTDNAMKYHLRKEHLDLLVKPMRNYYIDESMKFDKEIDEMLYECYQRKADDHHNRSDRLNRYWFDFRKKLGSNSRVRCQICLASISVRVRGKMFSTSCALNHALQHVGSDLPLYKCTLCGNCTSCPFATNQHFRKYHQHIKGSDQHQYYTKNTNKFEAEIVAALKKCFNHPKLVVAPIRLSAKSDKLMKTLPVNKFLRRTRPKQETGLVCVELIKNSMNEFNRLECKVCSKELVVFNNQIFRIQMVEHAMLHSELPIYACSMCPFESSTRRGIMGHISNKHEQSTKKDEPVFRDNREKFKDEIIKVLKRCFEKD